MLGPKRQEAMLPDRALCLQTFDVARQGIVLTEPFLIVVHRSSLSLSLSLSLSNGEWGYSARRDMLGQEHPEAVSPARGVVLTDLQSYFDCQ